MFDIHNYDKDEYEKERKERLGESNPKSKEEHTPPPKEEWEEPRQEEKEGSSKRALIGIFLLGTVGFIGYLALGNQKSDTNPTPPKAETTNLAQETNTKEPESTTQDKPKEEPMGILTPVVQEKPKEELTTTITPISQDKPKEESTSPTDQPNQEKQNTIANDALTDTIQKELLNISTNSPTPMREKEPVVTSISSTENIQKESKTTPTPITKEETKTEIIDNIPKETLVTEPITVAKVVKPKPKKRVKKIRRRMVIVRKGDTLASISKRFYGNSMLFNRIVRANYSIKRSSTPLKIGQRIHVPR